MKISVVGGGRWARTIAAVLGSMPGSSDLITLHSPGNSAGVEAWIRQLGLVGEKLSVAHDWPVFAADEGRPDAVVIANRLEDHFAAASAALQAGIPTLVEKPVCLHRGQIEHLCRVAGANVFGVSQVFLFARYFEAFAASVAERTELRSLRFVWTDGVSDVIRGEAKSYDPSVTIFDDVLPHIVPLIGRLTFRDLALVSLDVQRGGARIEIEATSQGRLVTLVLARNDEGRRRHIEVMTGAGPMTLDFASEPGFIEFAGRRQDGDPSWNSAPRPLATMLSAFMAAANGAAPDERLSPSGAIAAASLAEAVRDRYLTHQAKWLESRLREPLDPSLHYALTELSGDATRDTGSVTAAWHAMESDADLKTFVARSPFRSGQRQDK